MRNDYKREDEDGFTSASISRRKGSDAANDPERALSRCFSLAGRYIVGRESERASLMSNLRLCLKGGTSAHKNRPLSAIYALA